MTDRRDEENPRPYSFFGNNQRLTRAERVRRDYQRSQNSPVPTWVMAAALVGIVAAFALFVALY